MSIFEGDVYTTKGILGGSLRTNKGLIFVTTIALSGYVTSDGTFRLEIITTQNVDSRNNFESSTFNIFDSVINAEILNSIYLDATNQVEYLQGISSGNTLLLESLLSLFSDYTIPVEWSSFAILEEIFLTGIIKLKNSKLTDLNLIDIRIINTLIKQLYLDKIKKV